MLVTAATFHSLKGPWGFPVVSLVAAKIGHVPFSGVSIKHWSIAVFRALLSDGANCAQPLPTPQNNASAKTTNAEGLARHRRRRTAENCPRSLLFLALLSFLSVGY